jgi:hypothetical protein
VVEAEMDDAERVGAQAKARDCAVAHERARHDHQVRASHGAVPRERPEDALPTAEQRRQVEVLHVVQRHGGRPPHGRDPERERVVKDVGVAQMGPERPGAGGGRGHRDEPLRDRPRGSVLTGDHGRQPFARIRGDGRREHEVLAVADASESAQQLARVCLAAAELAGDERQQRDPDHPAILDGALAHEALVTQCYLQARRRLTEP